MDSEETEKAVGRAGTSPHARLAISFADRHAAYRLRYARYVAEQGKPYPEADHSQQILTDELDPEADIVIVEVGGEVGATVRSNWFDSMSTRTRYSSTFELSRFANIAHARICACSRLAVSAGVKYAGARDLLFDAIYERALDRGAQLCFITCAPALVRLFQKYGFREFGHPINDRVVGKLSRLLLVLHDLPHLERSGSSFFKIASGRGLPSESQRWLSDLLNEYRPKNANT
jgi:predicted GNAT family N-acyltransferase